MQNASDIAESLPDNGLYPIRTVSAATGVNPVTLRAWERRYGLLKPLRTPKGHRLYTKDHIETIRKVVALLEQGMAIGQVMPLLADTTVLAESGTQKARPMDDVWQGYRTRLLDGINSFDPKALDHVYAETLSLYPVDSVTTRLTIPVLETLGARWKTEAAGIGAEHFFNAYLRNKIGARFHHMGALHHGPRLITACVPGELHETGLLLFCLSALSHGFRLIYLGANLPLEQLPEIVARSAADAVTLSSVTRMRQRLLSEQLPDVVRRLGVPLFFGGRGSTPHQRAIASAGAIPLGDDIAAALKKIRATLGA